MSQTINFGTYNTHLYMRFQEHEDDERCAAIANWGYNRELDVMGFSEVWNDTAKEEICKNFKYSFFYATGIFDLFEIGSGLVLASKYPIYDAQFTEFSTLVGEDGLSQKGYIRAVIHTPNSGDFRVYLTHTQANANIDPGKIGIGSTSAEARKSNLEQIAEDMKTYYPRIPAIVMGDLNVIGESEEYISKPGVLSSMVDTYRKLHTDSEKDKGWTWDADTNDTVKVWDKDATGGERLDYILYSNPNDWSAVSCAVDTSMKESDHYPLTATLNLNVNTSYLLADTWEGAKGLAQKWKGQYGTGASTLIVITNDTDEDIHLIGSHDWHGSFYTALPSILPTGKSAGILHVHPAGKAIGSKGCIIMRQGSFDYFLGFRTPHDASKNKVYVECRGNGHWWTHGSQDHMSYLLDDSDKSGYSSSDSRIDTNNKHKKVKSGTETGTSPLAFFVITSKEDPRPVPTLNLSGGDFTYDGQLHPVRIENPTYTVSIPLFEKTFNLDGNFKITYDPGSTEPKDVGKYTAHVNFRAKPLIPISWVSKFKISFQNAIGQATININKANPKIIVNGGEVTFNEYSHPVTASATGLAGEELPMTLSYQGTSKAGDSYGPTADPPIVAGKYQVTVSTSGDKNHNAGSKTATLTIKPAPAVVIAPEALEVRKGHSTHTNNIGHWLKHDEKIEVWDVWRGEDEVWVQHDNSGQHGPGWSAMEYKGKTFVEFVTSTKGKLEKA